jgi:MarR family transcriptional regulator, organic hydroperoxide resistance regulator
MQMDEVGVADLELVFSELIRLQTRLWDAVDVRLRADCGLALSWFEPMRVVDERQGCRVQDVAAELAITVGGASKLVDRIEQAGHCRRRANPLDGRSSIIELTPTGTLLLARAHAVVADELVVRLAGVLGDQELDRFAMALAALHTAQTKAQAK